MSTLSTPKPPVSTGPLVAATVAGVLAVAGVVLAVIMAFTGPSLSYAGLGPDTGRGHASSGPVEPPSASVELLQQQLAQLNYYEGPITGHLGPETRQAIEYLQRDAHLPQTGELDSATRAALLSMLQNGNNQMG